MVNGFCTYLFYPSWLFGGPKLGPHQSFISWYSQPNRVLNLSLCCYFWDGWYTSLGTTCNCIMATTNHSNAAMPFVSHFSGLMKIFLLTTVILLQNVKFYCSIHELTACTLCLFRWLCCVNECVYACFTLLIFMHVFIMSFQCPWVLYPIYILYVCLLTNGTHPEYVKLDHQMRLVIFLSIMC